MEKKFLTCFSVFWMCGLWYIFYDVFFYLGVMIEKQNSRHPKVPVILMKKHFIGGYTDLLETDKQCRQDLMLDPRDRKLGGSPACSYLYPEQYMALDGDNPVGVPVESRAAVAGG